MLPLARPRSDPDLGEAVLALLKHEVILEHFNPRQQHIVSMRDDLPPMLRPRLPDECLHQAEILRVEIRADVELVVTVVHVVLVLPFSRQEDGERAGRVVCLEKAILGAERLKRRNHQVFLGLGLEHGGAEGLVRFLVDQLVV